MSNSSASMRILDDPLEKRQVRYDLAHAMHCSSPKRSAANVPDESAALTPTRPGHTRRPIPAFTPHPSDPNLPINEHVEEFLYSHRFELMCCQAMQLAGIIPLAPPPIPFLSFETTPLHQYYEAIIVEFANSFARVLRNRRRFPVILEATSEGTISTKDDIDKFNFECRAHINAILGSFAVHGRHFGSLENLSVDETFLNANIAVLALREVTQTPAYPPKVDWKDGEPLHCAYRKRLWCFRVGVLRQIQESEDTWILDMGHELERGIAAFAEFYMAHLREEWLMATTTPAGQFLRYQG